METNVTDRETNGQRDERNYPSIMFIFSFSVLFCIVFMISYFILLY